MSDAEAGPSDTDTPATDTPPASCGVTLVLGDELDATATEVVAGGRAVRLTDDDLRVLRGVPGADAVAGSAGVLVFAADVDGGAAASPEQLAAAAALAWEHVVTTLAELSPELTRADSEQLGTLDLAGRPRLGQVLADRRRGSSLPEAERDATAEALRAVIADRYLRARFALVELASASPDDTPALLAEATADDGLLAGLRILVAAEEALARVHTGSVHAESIHARSIHTGSLATTLAAVERLDSLRGIADDLLPTLPTGGGLRSRLGLDRSAGHSVQVARALEPLVATLRPESSEATADEVRAELRAADSTSTTSRALVPAAAQAEAPFLTRLSAEQMAEWLGEAFAGRIDEVRTEHEADRQRFPGESASAAVDRVRRTSLARLDALDPTRAAAADEIRETVVDLALRVALARGVAPHSADEYRELGRRVVRAAEVAGNLRIGAHRAAPTIEYAAARLFRLVQRQLVEAAFAQMSVLRPARGSDLRGVYKAARRHVWGLRHDAGLGDQAGDAAVRGVVAAVDRAGNRVLVWQVVRAVG